MIRMNIGEWMDTGTDREFVNSLAKGLNLLMCFTNHHPMWSLSELAKANDMNLPTARRYLHTFAKLGFMIKDETTKTFHLTSKTLRLGGWVIESMGIKDRLMPHMKAIRNDLDVTTHCAVLEGKELVAIDRILSSDLVNLDLSPGSRLPVHATSLGKAILAFMDIFEQKKIAGKIDFKPFTPRTITNVQSFLADLKTTKSRGYAISNEEVAIGLKTLAIPIFNQTGIVEAAFGVSFPLSRTLKQGFEDSLIERLFDLRDKIG